MSPGIALPSNRADMARAAESRGVGRVQSQDLRVVFGTLYDYNPDTFQVKVLLKDGTFFGVDWNVGDWVPLMSDVEDIMLRFGSFTKLPPLQIRVWYYGSSYPQNGIAEIIASEDTDFLKQKPQSVGKVAAYKFGSPRFP